jgi:hypothetical protein
MVNLMRACSLASAIMKDGGRKPKRKKEDDE